MGNSEHAKRSGERLQLLGIFLFFAIVLGGIIAISQGAFGYEYNGWIMLVPIIIGGAIGLPLVMRGENKVEKMQNKQIQSLPQRYQDEYRTGKRFVIWGIIIFFAIVLMGTLIIIADLVATSSYSVTTAIITLFLASLIGFPIIHYGSKKMKRVVKD